MSENKRTQKKKPWYRLRNTCLALLSIFLITIAWASNEVWTVYTAKPNPTIDYSAKLQLLAEQHAQVSHSNGEKSWMILSNALAKAELINSDMEAQISQRGFVARHEYDSGSIEYDRVYGGRKLPKDFKRETDTIKLMQIEGVFKLLQQFTESGKGIRQSHEY